ncbi:MAG: OB-fold nucleic acid binding domain-containing protein [Propionibacteriaceae bacterium]|jgi:hypothetical protein|nr:OB-fold nucleic acid binding domain-containing protein [Propionibacteriaceae bacterium]
MAKDNPLWRALKRWGAAASAEAEDLAAPEGDIKPVVAISEAKGRAVVRLRGVVGEMEMKPRHGAPWLEAEFRDDTGEMTLIWMGRKEIPGISKGRELKVEGRLAIVNGKRCLYNPRYELLVN